jgi:hypothetical protein
VTEDDKEIVEFFEALLDDDVEKQIIRLIDRDMKAEEILEMLLGKRGVRKRD